MSENVIIIEFGLCRVKDYGLVSLVRIQEQYFSVFLVSMYQVWFRNFSVCIVIRKLVIT